ncbi:MAG: right-handed parallel beta-helix repeat-containing protein [Lachnospiraceae bacterium]|nr:right-handed parallel beta-helix repeat-containing protein [Lachnospiraceae bacterium]
MGHRIFYVDSVDGNDLNSGTVKEKPWKSLDRVNRMILEPGDEVLFRCGGRWRGMLSLHGNGERFAPVRISSYGEGGRPEIDGDGSYAGVFLQGVSHYILENLRVANRAGERTVRQGICVEAKEEGITEYITIRNCEVLEVAGENRRARDVYCSMYWNGGIYITIPGRSSEKNHLHHIHILNNHIHDVRTSGIRINQEEDFINDIHHTSIVVRGNRIERTGSDGIIVANSISPLIDGNRCYDAGALGNRGETKLIAGIWVCAASNALIQRNEVARTRLFDDDGTAFDTDWGTAGTTVFQYNYTHDNEGGFWLDCSSLNYHTEYEKTVLRYNISIRDGRGIAVSDKGLPVEFYGNVFAFEKDACVCVWEDGRDFRFRNNELFWEKPPRDGWGRALFCHNHYDAQVCPHDMQRMEKSGIDVRRLLEHAGDGMEWLQDQWELLNRLLMRDCVD